MVADSPRLHDALTPQAVIQRRASAPEEGLAMRNTWV
jgi:hypothetical protein